MSISSVSLFRSLVICLSLTFASAWGAEESTLPVLADIPYKTGEQLSPYEVERCKLDLFLPAQKAGYPTIVWLHGGGITAGSKDSEKNVAIARHFAAAGVAMAMVNYRLSPKAKFPAYIDDSAAAFAWVKQHISEHGGDPAQVFLSGHSAGAYLALMVGLDASYLQAYGLETTAIRGMIPIAGQTLTHYTVRIEQGLPKSRLYADAAAPLNHVRKDAPPTLILYADKDMAMRAEENELLAAAMRDAGHKNLTISMIKNRTHSGVAHDMANQNDPAFEQVMAFIQSLKP